MIVSSLNGDLRPKLQPCFYEEKKRNFMEEEPCTKFCGVVVKFHEVIKLQGFKLGESDVISANVQNISPLVFFAIFLLVLCRKNLQ